MSVKRIKDAMRRFLQDKRPQVLCITGKWGTGKTYAWNEALESAAKGDLPISNYAYVSLFGLKEAADILQTAYINADDLKHEKRAKLDQHLANVGMSVGDMKTKFKKLAGVIAGHASVPWVSGLGGVARAAMSSLIHDTIICIDDIERKGSTVSMREIMGVVAQLRDTRACKVVLILNEDNLEEKDREEFARYAEKVIDLTYKFVSTAEEAAAIAFKEADQLSENLRKAAIELGITNIRVLMKIGDYAREMTELLKGIDPDVSLAAIRSLVLLGWSILSPGDQGAPTLTYLLDKRYDQWRGNRDLVVTPTETAWGALLAPYGFNYANAFDRTLVEELQRGYFDWGNLKVHIEKGLSDTNKARGLAAIENAWRLAREYFHDNAHDVAEAIHKASVNNIAYLTPIDLDGTVTLLREIGFLEKAKDLLDTYMEARGHEDIFDYHSSPFGSHIRDPDVLAAFDKILASKPHQPPPSPFAAATTINTRGWGSSDEDTLRRLTVDDFEKLFMKSSPSEVSTLARAALSFYSISNARPEQIEISDRARDALIRIGQTNTLNRFRVRGLGIVMPDPGANAGPETQEG